MKVSYFTEEGREVVLGMRGTGEMLGELAAVDGQPRSATATALDPIEALVLSAADFQAYLGRFPRVALLLVELVGRKLRDADRKRVEFASYDTIARMALLLLELSDTYGEQSDDGVRIGLPLTQQELAGWVGSSREAVSKALQTMRTRGWITTERRSVTVHDRAALEKRVR